MRIGNNMRVNIMMCYFDTAKETNIYILYIYILYIADTSFREKLNYRDRECIFIIMLWWLYIIYYVQQLMVFVGFECSIEEGDIT